MGDTEEIDGIRMRYTANTARSLIFGHIATHQNISLGVLTQSDIGFRTHSDHATVADTEFTSQWTG